MSRVSSSNVAQQPIVPQQAQDANQANQANNNAVYSRSRSNSNASVANHQPQAQVAQNNMQRVNQAFSRPVAHNQQIDKEFAKAELKILEADMKKGDHIRGSEAKIKSNHGKTSVFNKKNRAAKFKAGRDAIETKLTRALGDADQARAIMAPFDNSDHGLSKLEMSSIVESMNNQLDQNAAAADEASRVVKPMGPILPEAPSVTSDDPQADLDMIRGFMTSPTGKHLSKNTLDLDNAFQMAIMSETMDEIPDAGFVGDVLGLLQQNGFTMDQLRDFPTADVHQQEVLFSQENNSAVSDEDVQQLRSEYGDAAVSRYRECLREGMTPEVAARTVIYEELQRQV